MKASLISSIAVLALAAFQALAAPSAAIEDSRELEPRMITLPSSLDGTLAVQGCSACTRQSYALSRDVRFYVQRQEVSFAEYRRYLAAHPEVQVLLVTRPKQNIVTRLTAQ